MSCLIVLLMLSAVADAIVVEIDKDVRAVIGQSVTVECQADDLDGSIRECVWQAPSGKKYYNDERSRDDISVELDDRKDICELKIRSLRAEHQGAWKCTIEDRRDENFRYAFVRADDPNGEFTVTLDEDQSEVVTTPGRDVELVCTSNAQVNSAKDRLGCTFIAPGKNGKAFRILSRGAIYNYPEDNIYSSRNPDDGVCAILIKDIPTYYFGVWTCQISRTKSSGHGSEGASYKIPVRFRQSRLQEEEGFQDYRVGERDAEVCVEAEVDYDKYDFVDHMWIVRRKFRVFEGDEKKCFRDERDDPCYSAARGKYVSRDSDDKEFCFRFDRLEDEDVENPLMFIQQNTDKRGSDLFKVIKVPKTTERFTSEGGFPDETGRSKCMIEDQRVDVGDSVKLRDLCIELRCEEEDGRPTVQARRLRNCEDDDRRDDRELANRDNRNGREFEEDFSERADTFS